MRVVFLDQSGQPGGAELMLADLVAEMPEAEVLLFEDGPFRHYLEERSISVQVAIPASKTSRIKVNKNSGIGGLLRAVPQLLSLFGSLLKSCKGADVLYANTSKAWALGALCALALRKPLVCHLHDIISPRHFSGINRAILVQAANRASFAVIANSQATAEAFVSAGGNAGLVTVIPNGFDLNQFSLQPKLDSTAQRFHKCHVRTELNIPKDNALVAVMGRLSPWKGQDIAIKAIASIPNVHCLIIGDALFTDEDRLYARSLPDLAASLGCAERIHFMGFQKEVIPLLHQLDVLIHCSTAPEPFGRVIVEAMLCHVPVIAANEGGAAEIISPDKTGLHHRAGDPVDLANQLSKLLNAPKYARQLAEEARVTAQSLYDLNSVRLQTLAVMNRSID